MECFQVMEAGEGIEESRVSERHPALLVVSPRAAEQGMPLPRQCRMALVPGALTVPLRAASAVSYGASPRDSLTISSREGDRLWVALQREVVTVEGMVVERQEFPVTLPPGEEPLPVLAAAGALLLLGVPPEEVDQSLSR